MTAQELVKSVLQSPSASKVSQNSQLALKKEQKKRLAFYKTIDENMKAEFINGEIVVHSPVRSKHNTILGQLSYFMKTAVQFFKGYIGIEKL